MTYLFTASLIILNIFNAIKKQKSKLLLFLFIVLLATLMGGNTSNPDYQSYEIYYYNYGDIVAPDIGYRVLNSFFNGIGISYEVFRIVITVVSFYLIYFSIKKFSENIVFVYLLFSLYPFMLDIVQIRNFLMTSIVIYATTLLVNKSKRTNILFIFLVLFASTIHLTAIVYLPIIFIVNTNSNILVKFSLSYIIIIGILISINKDVLFTITNPIFNFLSEYDSRFDVYNSIDTRFGYYIYWGIQLSSFALTKWSKKIIKSNLQIEDKKKRFINIIYSINLYMLIFLPFYVFEITYYRYARNIMILNYIVFSITYKYIKGNKYNRLIYLFLVILMTLIYFYVGIFIPHKQNIISPVFEYNWILN